MRFAFGERFTDCINRHPHTPTPAHTAGLTYTHINSALKAVTLSVALSLLSVCRGVVAFMSLQNIFILAIISLDTRMSVVGVCEGIAARHLMCTNKRQQQK